MSRPIPLKDNLLESRLFLHRVAAALVACLLLLGILVARLVYLQVIAHDHYRTLSEKNRIKTEPLPPNRGLIYDARGILLAENLPSYRLVIIPEQVPDMEDTLRRLARVIEIRPDDLERFRRLLARSRRFEAVPIRLNLSDAEVARFAVERYDFPGVDIQAALTRHYPLGPLTAHVVGYVGRINERDLQRLDPANYRGSTHTGKTGIERTYESVLHGTVGYRQVETNAQGRPLREISRQPPIPGSNLHLTLDVRLQAAAAEAFGDRNGAAVAIDPRTGAVLAMVSQPGFDPDPFVRGIPLKAYRALQRDPDRPLFDRALRGQYPPGSTLKPFVALAGLELGLITPRSTTWCPGYYQLPGKEHKYRDWKRWGHGLMNLRSAIAQSCDVYFYDLARSLGIDRMHDFLARFGFGRRTGIDLVGEASGLLPSSAWKRRVHHQPWFPGETLIAGIGQGFDLATPLQLAVATATLATYGRYHRPYVVAEIQQPGEPPVHLPHDPPVVLPVHDRHNWQEVIRAMVEVVHGRHGTAQRVGKGIHGFHIAGKTGTAQVFGLPQEEKYDARKLEEKLRDHALFIAFAPARDPRIAVAVVVEHGGSGGAVAGPIARRILDRYFADHPLTRDAGNSRTVHDMTTHRKETVRVPDHAAAPIQVRQAARSTERR
ncbi:MAG: penicillin-binding protein 2 [Gammaproteobacteria bacterium]|nr:MAG: penicillin-binding protein 2 [Gammaproteobacteria bacterium]